MSALRPLQCTGCGAAVPLVDAPRAPCPFCQHEVVAPPAYIEAVAARRELVAARQRAEPRWKKLEAGSSVWWKIIGAGAMALAPPVMTAIGLGAEPAHATASVFALFTLPAMFPGGVVFVWGATSDISHRGIRSQLAARPPREPGSLPSCRECGAPVAIAPGEISCTCLYCGTDSIVTDVPLGAIVGERQEALETLADATRAVRVRAWLVRLAVLGTAAFLTGVAFALYQAQLALG